MGVVAKGFQIAINDIKISTGISIRSHSGIVQVLLTVGHPDTDNFPLTP